MDGCTSYVLLACFPRLLPEGPWSPSGPLLLCEAGARQLAGQEALCVRSFLGRLLGPSIPTGRGRTKVASPCHPHHSSVSPVPPGGMVEPEVQGSPLDEALVQ